MISYQLAGLRYVFGRHTSRRWMACTLAYMLTSARVLVAEAFMADKGKHLWALALWVLHIERQYGSK
jgi:hypothetical protein